MTSNNASTSSTDTGRSSTTRRAASLASPATRIIGFSEGPRARDREQGSGTLDVCSRNSFCAFNIFVGSSFFLNIITLELLAGVEAGSARREFLAYCLSLLRAHSAEHAEQLPVLDVAALKHVAYVLDALVYYMRAAQPQPHHHQHLWTQVNFNFRRKLKSA